MPVEVVRGSDGEDLGRTRLSLNRDRNALIEVSVASASEKLPIVAETDTKDSRFPSESAFRSLHRFRDLRRARGSVVTSPRAKRRHPRI